MGVARPIVRPGAKTTVGGSFPNLRHQALLYVASKVSAFVSPPTHTMFSPTCCMSPSKSLRPGSPARGCPCNPLSAICGYVHKQALHRSNAKREFWEAVTRARARAVRASGRGYEGDELSP